MCPSYECCKAGHGFYAEFFCLHSATCYAGKDGVVKAVYNNQFDPESHIPAALDAL